MKISSGYVFARQISPGEVPSVYVSRKTILEWIVRDKENYINNYEFEVPDVICFRPDGAWTYDIYETAFWLSQTLSYRRYQWVMYIEGGTWWTNTFDTREDGSAVGYYAAMQEQHVYNGFGYDSAIMRTAQRGWRSTAYVQAENGIGSSGYYQYYGVKKINIPVFRNWEDASEFFGYVNAYLDDQTTANLNALKNYLATTNKMLNP